MGREKIGGRIGGRGSLWSSLERTIPGQVRWNMEAHGKKEDGPHHTQWWGWNEGQGLGTEILATHVH